MSQPIWSDPTKRDAHFQKHGWKFGHTSVHDYEASTLDTINVGVRFNYTDPGSGDPRVGHYDVAGNRLTALTDDERTILTHYPPDRGEQYIRELPDSTYT